MSRWALRHIALSLPMMLAAAAAWAQPAYLVSDLFPGNGQSLAVAPNGLVTVGNRVFFFGNLGDLTPRFGDENVGLWVSDGTASGTQPLAKLCFGECTNHFLGASGPSAFFLAGTDNGDHVLWRSDGTRAGTIPLNLGGPALSGAFAAAGIDANHAFLNGVLYFAGCLGNGCDQLWRSDGTLAGTTLVADFSFDEGILNNPPLGQLTPFRGKLYFLNPDPRSLDGAYLLWRSDGTSAGTLPFTAPAGQSPFRLAAAASQLFVVAFDTLQNTYRLWVTDGTTDPHPFAQFAYLHAFDDSSWLKPEGNQVYFVANDGTHGNQIWVSDGTAAGTVAVTGFTNSHPFDPSPAAISANRVERLGSRLVFFATDGTNPLSLWATSGTPGSTVPLCPGTCGPLAESTRLWKVGERILTVTGSVDGYTLWSTDGTAGGTLPLRQLCSADCQFAPFVQPIGAELFFEPDDGVLWQTDGTIAGTKPYANGLVSDFSNRNGPLSVAGLGSRLLFNELAGLWLTDGTKAGTRLLTTKADSNNVAPGGFLALGNRVFFTSGFAQSGDLSLWQSAGSAATTVPMAGVPEHAGPLLLATAGSVFFMGGSQLWRADGSATGTRQLTNLSPAAQEVVSTVPFQGKLFFTVLSETNVELWQSDGTPQGTVKVLELPPLPANMEFDRMWAAGGFIFYTGIDRNQFVEQLWRSDGTPAGTFELAGVPYQGDPEVTPAGGWIYFAGTPGLLRTDGTVAGTAPVLAGSQPVGGEADDSLAGLTEVGGVLYLFVTKAAVSTILWRSDGTGSGTFALHQFPDNQFFNPAMTTVGSHLLFAVDDGVHGVELWTSDGSVAGTGLLRDINAGPLGSHPSGFTVAAGRAFFTADDGVHGPELWETDGTAGGTRLVQDIWPGPAGSIPAGMIQAGGLLFFTADDGLTGTQLWALPLTGATACAPGPSALCLLGDRFKVEALWQDPQGNTGTGQAVALTPDTGSFWFFSPQNLEVVAKVIDGRALDGNFWFFYGALSNVQYWLTVTDSATGAVRRYLNPQGQLASVGDTAAFGPQGAFSIIAPANAPAPGVPIASALRTTAEDASRSAGACQPGPARLCLNGSRFAVTVAWQDFSGRTGKGTAVDLTSDTGTFWFFNATNVELMLKVLDGRAVNGKFWVFFGALSNVSYTVTVQDTVTGSVRTYTNPAGQFASVADTSAF